MTFRRKLLAVVALTVSISVATIAWVVSDVARRAFDRAGEERTAALVAQFQREFHRRGEDVVRRVEAIAASDDTTRMALAVGRGSPDYGAYFNLAKSLGESQQLDFVELVDGQGTIISSAQWPAKFGYKENSFAGGPPALAKDAFLKREELPDGVALGLCALRVLSLGDKPLYVIGGRKLDRDFLATLDLPAGMRAVLYENLGPGFSPQLLIDASGNISQPDKLAPIVQQVQQSGNEASVTVHWSSNPRDDEIFQAIPLQGGNSQLLGILLVGSSRRDYVEVNQRIRSAALLIGGAGILLSILLSAWAATRVIRPVENLAAAAKEVGAGNLRVEVPVNSADELGQLAEAFNQMTRELLEQKERLVQTERVAAWRELARRLAHELKNPLFPLQLTVENLIRAHRQSPEQFDDVLQESSSTLLAEIANLKKIISRFSEFSAMPQPHFQRVQINEVVAGTERLFQAQLRSSEKTNITCQLDLDPRADFMAADPELLHRAITNLVLNAIDAMPQGGTLTIRTREEKNRVHVEISDTGTGLQPEECERLFTPYYTNKQQGTGLGLAIVQSIVTDHGGSINVRSAPGRGTTFHIELPRNLDKLTTPGQQDSRHVKESTVAAKSTSTDRG
ncbi:MAG TPA: ATP-binding protein [Terriglobales bacterium]|nr:ATP-binding protein [Terriglobales bacterium]